MTRRRFLRMLAITCLAPLRMKAGLAVPARKIPPEDFYWAGYLPVYTTPPCLPIPDSTEIAMRMVSVQPMPSRSFGGFGILASRVREGEQPEVRP